MLKHIVQLPITARMYIAAPAGRLGLRGAAARRSATWPLALVGLGATSHTCVALYAIALNLYFPHNACYSSADTRHSFIVTAKGG
jgi:hypothetical protein